MKISNEVTVKELKQNATAAQMKELLSEDTTIADTSKVDVNALLNRLNQLETLVRETWDTNKIKDHEKSLETLNKFSFSLKLFPTSTYDCPVIKWRTVSNFVDLSEDKIKEDQVIEITYLTKDGKEETKNIKLVQFATFLKRSDKLVAKSIKNLDGSDVYISKQINPETKLEYYTMKPNEQTYEVTLSCGWHEITILTTYLNA